jgi:hypothetical protein
MGRAGCCRLLPLVLLLAPGLACAQTSPGKPAAVQQRDEIKRQLQELSRSRQDLTVAQQNLQKQIDDFDGRIAALEAKLGVAPAADSFAEEKEAVAEVKDADARVSPTLQTGGEGEGKGEAVDSPPTGPPVPGSLQPGKGLVLAEGAAGGLAFGVNGYVRYLNQGGLDSSYKDSFGRTFAIDKRQDFQLNRLQINFRGWLWDEKFRYNFYAWTQNVSQGDPAQVVVGGNIRYEFSDSLWLWAGIFSLPSTRSTAQSFPNWLRIDHRGMADEYFRGSYSEGVQAMGKLPFRLFYNVAVTDNLSVLGVSATQLPFGPNTVSGAVYWMPTTGEYGPGSGFGDYEYHKDVATLFGFHQTYSRETAQAQPGVNAFENAQIRLSDGTLLFSPNAFNTGGQITKATYNMFDVDMGVKYRGWSFDAEIYNRWLGDFDAVGFIPVTHVYDHGYQVYASTMLMPRVLQGYFSGSHIYGTYGDPWDAAFGFTWFPFAQKNIRWNAQMLYTDRSPVGYTAIPYQLGGTGWIATVDVGTWF